MTIYEIVFQGTKTMLLIKRKIFSAVVAATILVLIFRYTLSAQSQNKPQAFRSYEEASVPLVLPSTLDLQLLEAFVLMQKANAGESPAQHELGLRYLLGKGFPADTVKAAFWIQKAACQKLPLAQFNFGILQMNGMGIEWNPFEAFKYFRAAAKQEIPEALYVVGLQYTENFVIPRNWKQAYRYFKKASELGSEGAKIAKKEMERRGLDKIDTTDIVPLVKEQQSKNVSRSASKDTSFNLLLIDFHTDTITTIEDTVLIREAYHIIDTSSNILLSDNTPKTKLDTSARSVISASAEAGCPEALCLLGRCFEHGINVRKDLILAGVYYLRALHLDSYRAPALLWKMMNTEEFARELELQTSKENPDAFYVWSGLTSIGFNKLLNEKQAFDLLQRAASVGHAHAMVELGSCYFTGRWAQKNRDKAIELWNRASALGSTEADIRLAAANVLGQINTQELSTAISLLSETAKQGSLFSDLTLAYCYEKGIGLSQDKGEAYRIFRKSMQRGSETAFHAIRSMHDEIRPQGPEFQMAD